MKTLKKNVYYCDHCKKRGLSASHMIGHEKVCTANPLRKCKLCEGINIPEILEGYKKRYALTCNDGSRPDDEVNNDEYIVNWIGEKITLKEVVKDADGCPNCTLALLRQSGLNKHYFHLDKFDYQKEMAMALSEKYAESNSSYDY